MEKQELLKKQTELTAKISELPKGYISEKSIGGKVYYYHQWSEKGVKQSKYLRGDEIAPLSEKIERRKELQAQLRRLRATPASQRSGKSQIRN